MQEPHDGAGRPALALRHGEPALAIGALHVVCPPRDSIPALVLAVIAQVYELSGHRTQPWYVDRSALDLVEATDSVDSAIYYAEVSAGWWVPANLRRALR